MNTRLSVNLMSTQTPQKSPSRLAALKEATPAFLFLLVAILVEYLAVSYALSLGLKDEMLLQYSFKFPGTDWGTTIAISPLFHLVPIAVIISLATSWAYLSRRIIVRPQTTVRGRIGPVPKQVKRSKIGRFFGKIESSISRNRAIAYLAQKIHSIRPTARSATAVVFLFLLFTLTLSLLAYPNLIYQIIVNAYQTNPSLLGFVKSVSNALEPVGRVFSSVNDALLAASPGFKEFALSVGGIIGPLAGLDNVGKYLFIQNAAAWISGLIALLYGEFRGQRYRVRKK